jgi:hypothetical protein
MGTLFSKPHPTGYKLERRLWGHSKPIAFLAVSSDGQYIASGGEKMALQRYYLC